MQHMMETHFWSLTRYRIGPRFLGLDYAGNVIFFRGYRKQSFGGWTAVTLGAPGAGGIFTSDTSATNVLEDGYPMHYKASQKLQKFVMNERKMWQEEMSKKGKKGGDNDGVSVQTDVDVYDSDQRFRDTLIIKCSHPKFFSQTLRISPVTTTVYKVCYFYLWLVVISFIAQGYLMFRAWLHPPARQGLMHLEEHALHIPRLLFAVFVMGVAWLVREAQPIIDPLVDFLSASFPQINWGAASAESLATRAETLANDAHPAAKERKKVEEQQRRLREAETQKWWKRVLSIVVLFLLLLCIL